MGPSDYDHEAGPAEGFAARVRSAGAHARATAGDAAGQATATAAAAVKEIADLKAALETTLNEAGVDTGALAESARAHLTALERLAAEELARRPLRTLAIAAALGALFGAVVLR